MTPEQTEKIVREAFIAERELWGIPSEGDSWKDGAFTNEAIERAVQITLTRRSFSEEAIRMRHNEYHREYIQRKRIR